MIELLTKARRQVDRLLGEAVREELNEVGGGEQPQQVTVVVDDDQVAAISVHHEVHGVAQRRSPPGSHQRLAHDFSKGRVTAVAAGAMRSAGVAIDDVPLGEDADRGALVDDHDRPAARLQHHLDGVLDRRVLMQPRCGERPEISDCACLQDVGECVHDGSDCIAEGSVTPGVFGSGWPLAAGKLCAVLQDKVAIVSGAGWNIGRAVAVSFAAAGARVVLAARRQELLEDVGAEIAAAGGEALVVQTDVTDPAQVDALVAQAVERYGTVDVMAALAGGGLEPRRLEDVSAQAWQDIFTANVFSAFLCAKAVLPILREKNSGSVLTCTGGGAFFPMLGVEYNAYACAKAALCRFTDQMTAELWETGIRFNCLEPGKVLSRDALALLEAEEARSGQPHPDREGNRPPEDAAELALWLVSDASAPLRGRCVSVNDTWWRDPAQVEAVHATLHAYRLRRAEL